jgi:3-hydroxy-9,10-secoandrosta-1,3,5(10)-triene-9,17-dione monooxygenase
MHVVQNNITKILDQIAVEAEPSDAQGKITDESVRLLRESGVVRMLQPKDYGGYEAHPREFCETIMELTSKAPSIGWVAGVVGVHPFEFGQADPRLQEDIWGGNSDVWTASPYALLGQARRVDGGFVLSGRWPFSSGTDHCSWVILGGRAEGDIPGEFTEPYHLALPRSDYEILEDSWDVMGLRGTGSKDVVVREAFVPEYRAIEFSRLNALEYANTNRPNSPLYQMPWTLMFPTTIVAATLGIAEGVIHRFAEYCEARVNRGGIKALDNPFQMAALGAASADLQASRLHVLSDLTALYDHLLNGGEITRDMQYEARRNQVRATRRAAQAAQMVFQHVGGGAARVSNPVQRFWRDLGVAMCHVANVDDNVYAAYAAHTLGKPVPPDVII